MPVQRNAFKGSAFDHGFRLGLVLGLYRVYAVREHLFDLKALTACIGEPYNGVTAECSKAFPAVRFDIPEAPAFAAIGLN
ncbi:hypothetical protein D3C76_1408050 [compost metagenome]